MCEIKKQVAIIRDIITGSEMEHNIELDTALQEIETEEESYNDEINRLNDDIKELEEEKTELEKNVETLEDYEALSNIIKSVDDGGIEWRCSNANGVQLMEALSDALSNPKVNIIHLTNYLNQLAGNYAGLSQMAGA